MASERFVHDVVHLFECEVMTVRTMTDPLLLPMAVSQSLTYSLRITYMLLHHLCGPDAVHTQEEQEFRARLVDYVAGGQEASPIRDGECKADWAFRNMVRRHLSCFHNGAVAQHVSEVAYRRVLQRVLGAHNTVFETHIGATASDLSNYILGLHSEIRRFAPASQLGAFVPVPSGRALFEAPD